MTLTLVLYALTAAFLLLTLPLHLLATIAHHHRGKRAVYSKEEVFSPEGKLFFKKERLGDVASTFPKTPILPILLRRPLLMAMVVLMVLMALGPVQSGEMSPAWLLVPFALVLSSGLFAWRVMAFGNFAMAELCRRDTLVAERVIQELQIKPDFRGLYAIYETDFEGMKEILASTPKAV